MLIVNYKHAHCSSVCDILTTINTYTTTNMLSELIHILAASESTYVNKFCNYEVNTRERLFCLRLRSPNWNVILDSLKSFDPRELPK